MANKNEENDKLHRKGVSVKGKSTKVNSQVNEALKDEAKKQALRDFIFGVSEENPLANIRAGIPEKIVKVAKVAEAIEVIEHVMEEVA
jgi:hypothetical protein